VNWNGRRTAARATSLGAFEQPEVKGNFDMTMLTHTRGPFEQVPYSSGGRGAFGTGRAKAHLAMIKRFCMGALTILLAGSAVAAIMSLKIAIYLPRLIHH
jgi:hypothetical protein